MDKITLQAAIESLPWQFVWAGEPEREIEVSMTYSDLKRIVDWMKREIEDVDK